MTIFYFLQNSSSSFVLFFCAMPCCVLFFDLFIYSIPSVPFFKKETSAFCTATENALQESGIDTFWAMLLFVLGLSIVFCFLYFITRLPFGFGFLLAFVLSWCGLGVNSMLQYSHSALKQLQMAEEHQVTLEEFMLSDAVEAQSILLTPQEEIAKKSLQKAKQEIELLVWYDVNDMDIPALYRSLAEGILVQFQHSCATPFFWLCFFGPAGVWVIRTLELFSQFTHFSAHTTTVFSTLSRYLYSFSSTFPDRLTALFLSIVARAHHKESVRIDAVVIKAQAPLFAPFFARWSMATSAWLYRGKLRAHSFVFETKGNIHDENAIKHSVGTNENVLQNNDKNLNSEIQTEDLAGMEESDFGAQGFVGPITGVWTKEKVEVLLQHLHKVAVCFMIGVPVFLVATLVILRLIIT